MSTEKKLHRWQSPGAFYRRAGILAQRSLHERGLILIEPKDVPFFHLRRVMLPKGITLQKLRVLAALTREREIEPNVTLERVFFISEITVDHGTDITKKLEGL